ncbi:MAG: hypothetical protein K0Q55_3749 [Verrucomicrobia bacterium]|jgi:hypothetical protein|nr:hypothetical protein [Verrucomicrobiota bacterium]
MASQRSRWITRVLSIPALFLLPFLCGQIGNAFIPMHGDSFPVGGGLGFIAGFVAAVALSRTTVCARSMQFDKVHPVLLALIIFDVLAIPMAHVINRVLDPKVYDRASLRFTHSTPATVDVTGLWKGTITDKKRRRTETFFLNVTQIQGSVTGEIGLEFLGEMDSWPEPVKEGQVSGNVINLYWDAPAIARMVTLRGSVSNDLIKGEYFRHYHPPYRDWSQTGSWQATRIGPYKAPGN